MQTKTRSATVAGDRSSAPVASRAIGTGSYGAAATVTSARELAADPLSGVLGQVAVRAVVSGICELSAPWAIRLPTLFGGFYAVLEGGMVVHSDDGDSWAALHGGDVLIVTSGTQHVIADAVGRAPVPIEQIVPDASKLRDGVQHGGGGATTKIICGAFVPLGRPDALLGLPALLRVPGEASRHSLVPDLVRLLVRQASDHSPGSVISSGQLAVALLIESLRWWAGSLDRLGVGVLAASMDEHVGPVIGLVNGQPERNWSLQDLANEAGLSRSAFCERFSELVGLAPLAYVRERRMRRASQLLLGTSMELKEVAARTGYGSEGAFCTAFKRWAQCTPGHYRQQYTS